MKPEARADIMVGILVAILIAAVLFVAVKCAKADELGWLPGYPQVEIGLLYDGARESTICQNTSDVGALSVYQGVYAWRGIRLDAGYWHNSCAFNYDGESIDLLGAKFRFDTGVWFR